MLSEAIHFYAKAQYYSQAIKIAINNELDGEIMSLSMASPKEVAFRSASYFERKGLIEKAIRLYIKAGATKKANTLAEKSGFSELITNQTADDESGDEQDLIEGGDKEAINSKISAFLEANKFERALPLLVGAKQYERALDLCIQQNLPIQEDLIKKILPDEEPASAMEKGRRT
jgi:intraflagellar transport protein 140